MPNPPDEPRTWDSTEPNPESDPDQAVKDLRLSLETLKDKVQELRRALTSAATEEDRRE